ncbi:MAG: YbfB/YjiJ family MFS transporter, partial [Bifidobacteriaceae bacterium]|nr:YbfB/YjiJ family MFS transporter [Bifidobacteriaceae bacterium]
MKVLNPGPWRVVGQSAAALVVGIGVGRFAFTPILPAMIQQAGLSPRGGAAIATSNYAGYFVGALLGILFPRLVRFQAGFRWALAVEAASLAAMPLGGSVPVWSAIRCVSGIASAAVFMTGAAALAAHLPPRRAHLAGWGYSGVGAGIVLSGLAVAAVWPAFGWGPAWVAAAALAALAGFACWNLPLEGQTSLPDAVAPDPAPERRGRSAFPALAVAYGLEGAGYVIAGTFLVAALDESSAGWVGPSAWVLVGLLAVPSCAVWTALTRRFAPLGLLACALAIQALGMALPALAEGPWAAGAAAVLFGGTFMGAVA